MQYVKKRNTSISTYPSCAAYVKLPAILSTLAPRKVEVRTMGCRWPPYDHYCGIIPSLSGCLLFWIIFISHSMIRPISACISIIIWESKKIFFPDCRSCVDDVSLFCINIKLIFVSPLLYPISHQKKKYAATNPFPSSSRKAHQPQPPPLRTRPCRPSSRWWYRGHAPPSWIGRLCLPGTGGGISRWIGLQCCLGKSWH